MNPKKRGKQGGKAAAFTAGIADIAKALREKIEADCDGFAPDPAASAQRAARAKDDFRFFAQTYFPHHTRGGQPSAFHDWLFGALPAAVSAKAGVRLTIAAPRGNAKTTYCSQIFVLWCLLTDRKHYIVLLSDATDQAVAVLDGIKAELEVNRRLAMDFPQGVGEGRVWQSACIVTAGGVKLEAFGATKRLRGRRHGAHRPDLVICDDLENDENVRTPEQRDKLEGWIDKAVEPLGPPDGSMDIIYVGTVLHYDAVLSRKLKNKAWKAKTFKALSQQPDRQDLWQQWEEIGRNVGPEPADEFYERNREEMDAGAVVLWPAVQPLLALMKIKFRIGDNAFNSEYQNDPINQADALFGNIMFWVREVRHWIHFGACDPSLGKENKGNDPSAILVGALDRDSGILDVVEADIRRRLPDRIIQDVIRYQEMYRCLRWGIETVQFQAFFATSLVNKSVERKTPVPAMGLENRAAKELRIETIQPYVNNGLIRLHPSQVVLLEQLRHYPKGDHDDGPDCLEMLWRVATNARAGVPIIASAARGGSGSGGGSGGMAGYMGGMAGHRGRYTQ